jgi:polyisoprenoid-binding protein YceI
MPGRASRRHCAARSAARFPPRGAALLAALLIGGPAMTAPRTMSLSPPGAEVGLRAYALGMMPVDGNFTRFRGTVSFDADDLDRCQVELTIEAASLFMAQQSIRDDVVSPSFLDAAAFPTLVYRGGCATGAVRGMLTMHGQTHPLELELERNRTDLVATGVIHRFDWGMTERPIMVGSTVRIRVSAPWPPGWPALVGPAR